MSKQTIQQLGATLCVAMAVQIASHQFLNLEVVNYYPQELPQNLCCHLLMIQLLLGHKQMATQVSPYLDDEYISKQTINLVER